MIGNLKMFGTAVSLIMIGLIQTGLSATEEAIVNSFYTPGTPMFFAEKYEFVDFLSCADWAVAEVTFTDLKTKSAGKFVAVYKMVDGSAKIYKFIWNWD